MSLIASKRMSDACLHRKAPRDPVNLNVLNLPAMVFSESPVTGPVEMLRAFRACARSAPITFAGGFFSRLLFQLKRSQLVVEDMRRLPREDLQTSVSRYAILKFRCSASSDFLITWAGRELVPNLLTSMPPRPRPPSPCHYS